MRRAILLVAVIGLCNVALGQDAVFSGPQVDEKLSPFRSEYVFDEKAGEEVDLVKEADGGPIAIVFVHEITRPSVALTRLAMEYAHRRAPDGLASGIIFLTDDPTDMRARLKRARHALPKDVSVTISPEGLEGPGSYGLNRKVTLTILVAKENKVTANFALVQPGVAVDAPKIGAAIAEVLGDSKKPTLAEMGGAQFQSGETGRMADVPEFRSLMAPVIRKTQTEEQVQEAAEAVEKHAKENEAFRRRLGEVAQRIIDAGRLDTYGTPPAREYLKKWAKEYGPANSKPNHGEPEAKKEEPKSDDSPEG